jgi:hypothetical protein
LRPIKNDNNKDKSEYDRQYAESVNERIILKAYNSESYAVNNYQPDLMQKLNNFNRTYSQKNSSSQIRGVDQRKGPIK